MYVDIKVTIWQRIQLLDDGNLTKDKVIETIEREGISSLWDLENTQIEWESIVDTEEYMSPEENNKQSTVELYDDDGNLLWENSNNK